MNNFTPNQLLTQLILFFVLRNLKMNIRNLEFFTMIGILKYFRLAFALFIDILNLILIYL